MEEILNRRSIRKYKNTPVDKDIIDKLLDSARLAPSGNNTQPWHFIVITDERIKEEVAKHANNQKWMLTAPVFIACVADIRSRIKDDRQIEIDEESSFLEVKQIIRDTSIASEHIVLEAIAQNLGTCWVAWFTQKEMRAVLGIPEDKYLLSILTVGYPDENPPQRPRKSLEEIVRYNKW